MRRSSSREIAPPANGSMIDRDVGEGLAGERGDGLGRQRRPGLRHIEPAVARQPGQHDVLEPQRGRLASG